MKAVLKTKREPGFTFGEVDRPKPGLRDVVIKVKAAAICGSDLNFYVYEKGFCDAFIKELPFIPGHECAGEVVEVGRAVTHVQVGDRVAFDSHIPCGHCAQCQRGMPHTCMNMGLFGHNMNGCFAEYAMAMETGVRKLPPGMTFEQGAMLEPLGVVVRPVFYSEVGMANIGVAGCGAIGQFAIALARAMGANKIYAMDINEKRLALAKEMGATTVIDSGAQPEFADMQAPIDKEGAYFFLNQNSREPNTEPDEMVPLWKILHLAGADWTYGSKGWAAENYCLFLADDKCWEHVTRTSAKQADELGCKVFLNTE